MPNHWRIPPFYLVAFFLTASLPLVWIGDGAFLLDAAHWLGEARFTNLAGHIADHGLTGSRGTPYGPVPIWFYQCFLLLTHNIFWLAFLRTFFTICGLTWALWRIARTCPFLPRQLLPILFLSPYIWLYARDPWFAAFQFPLSAISIASYLEFFRKPALGYLVLAVSTATFAAMTHLMAVPLLFGLAAHFVLRERRWARKHFAALLSLTAALVTLVLPYLLYLYSHRSTSHVPGIRLAPVGFTFSGPVLFSSVGLERYFGNWYSSVDSFAAKLALSLAMLSSVVAFPIAWYGLCRAFMTVRGPLRDIRYEACLFCLLVLGFHLATNLAGGLASYPHLYLGVWPIFLFFFWLGWESIPARTWGRALKTTYASGLAISLFFLIGQLHVCHGNRIPAYGPSLGEQAAIAHELNRNEVSHLICHVGFFLPDDSNLTLLRLLDQESVTPPSSDTYVLNFSDDGQDGRMGLERMFAGHTLERR